MQLHASSPAVQRREIARNQLQQSTVIDEQRLRITTIHSFYVEKLSLLPESRHVRSYRDRNELTYSDLQV